ncbi:MAG: phenylalanine--tRNA ligase subunit alpha [Fimbriimonadales bacterium]|mgnify:FL=1|jgi:phenylalanyl-tRNA synthetase alpha chain|nr:phenylalanine--tRNA ligase subunit alpha [Armatimonadota bacterium]MCX7687415.1 phenylalanine--tRNA ligase subunit alpha [Fimbriimonadales bacterium]GIV14095.1 MAG: phenylalanine--tRNA ligase alpha subunit [Fimbriimonadales bacterium]CUU37234.1 phenylalanyl-tRNA synthetase, alpha subunit [Armatimonadetes bacterium DC]
MESIQAIVAEAESAIANCRSTAELQAVESHYLGKKGAISQLLRQIGTLPPEQRPLFGQQVNEARAYIETRIAERREVLAQQEIAERLRAESLDITLPGVPLRPARLHPLTLTMRRVKQALLGLGFEFVEGPELERFEYNFGALNYPEDHPAMDAQNSFHVGDGWLLRTQTTAIQGRIFEEVQRGERSLPLRIAIIGRCFRYENVDATHSHTFHQVDAFMVDEGVSMAHLKGTLTQFARIMFGEEVRVRFRPDFFPFVEPGVDFAISWKGGWLELGGAGLIHPNILEHYGIDSERYSGFAFGLGIERIPMLQYGIDDLRLFLENDMRFLAQFPLL